MARVVLRLIVTPILHFLQDSFCCTWYKSLHAIVKCIAGPSMHILSLVARDVLLIQVASLGSYLDSLLSLNGVVIPLMICRYAASRESRVPPVCCAEYL